MHGHRPLPRRDLNQFVPPLKLAHNASAQDALITTHFLPGTGEDQAAGLDNGERRRIEHIRGETGGKTRSKEMQ
jgi:hypothetical protein